MVNDIVIQQLHVLEDDHCTRALVILELPEVGDAADRDVMLINIAKCSFVRVGTGTWITRRNLTAIIVKDDVIRYVTSIKLLLTIQSDLEWDQHRNNKVIKATIRKYHISVLKCSGV